MKKLFSITGSVFLAIILGASGCVAGIKIDSEFQGGIFAQWKLIAPAPQLDMTLVGVLPCAYVTGDMRVRVWLIDKLGQAWQYDDCKGRKWQTASTVPSFESGSSLPCKIGDGPKLAESCLPGEATGCWRITWSWEVFAIRSYYVHLDDGRIMSWVIGGGFESLLRGAGGGLIAGLVLTIGFLFRHQLFSILKSRVAIISTRHSD